MKRLLVIAAASLAASPALAHSAAMPHAHGESGWLFAVAALVAAGTAIFGLRRERQRIRSTAVR